MMETLQSSANNRKNLIKSTKNELSKDLWHVERNKIGLTRIG